MGPKRAIKSQFADHHKIRELGRFNLLGGNQDAHGHWEVK